MADSIRTGRVVIPATQNKTIVLASLVGSKKAIYRIFNGGKDGTTVEIFVAGTKVHDLVWKDSVDLSIGNDDISVTAGANPAEIVYDLLDVV